jgi:hypothetical protein
MALSTAKVGIDVQIILSRVIDPPDPGCAYVATYDGPIVDRHLARNGATKEEAVDKITRILEKAVATWPCTDHETVSARLIVPERFITPAQAADKRVIDRFKPHEKILIPATTHNANPTMPAIQAGLMVKTTDGELVNLNVVGMDGQLEETLRVIASKAMNISRHSLAELVEQDNAS